MGRIDNQMQLLILDLDSMIPENHLLRQIKNSVNFDFIYEKASSFYSHTGRKSIDPVVMIKMLLIGYLYGIKSERRLEEEVSFSPNRVISEKTADLLCGFMETVVIEGSGQLALPQTGGAGGKTASAQTGIYDENEEEIVHAWFGGFYPTEDPQFAIVVFVENGQSGNRVAAPLFAQVADSLSGLELAQVEENTTIMVE